MNVNFNLRMFVYNLQSFNECLFYLKLCVIVVMHMVKLPAKCFLALVKLLGTHAIALCSALRT